MATLWDFLNRLLAPLGLDNERGQFNLSSLLGNLGQGTSQFLQGLFNPSASQFSLFGLNPQQLLGGGLIGGSTLAEKEPGSVTEARQFLRNRFTSPTALSEQFGGQVGAFQQQYEPLITQQQQRVTDLALNRSASLFPSSTGPQFGADKTTFLNLAREQFLPQRLAFLGDLSREGLGMQERAATSLLGENAQSQLGRALGQLGALLLLTGGRGGGTGGLDLSSLLGGQGGINLSSFLGGQRGQGFLGTDGASLLGGPGGGGTGLTLPQLLQAITNPQSLIGSNLTANPLIRALLGTDPNSQVGMLTNLAQLFTGGQSLQQGLGLVPGAAEGLFPTLAPQTGQAFTQLMSQYFGGQTIGAFEQAANGTVTVLDQAGNAIGTIGANGQVTNAAGQVVSNSFGATLGTVLGAAGVGLAGFGTGRALTGFLEQRNIGQGSTAKEIATGAASGAATGALIGSFIPGIGTAIGALIGAIAGGFGGSGAERRREDAQAESEAQTVEQARAPVIQEMETRIATIRQSLESLNQRYQALANAGTGFQSTEFSLPEGWRAGGNVISHLGAAIGRLMDAAGRLDAWLNRDGPGNTQALRTTLETGQFSSVLGIADDEFRLAQDLAGRVDAFLRSRGV